MVKLSADTQAYALNVKEMSMELSEASQDVLNGRSEDVEDNMNRVLSLYNGLLKRSDEYGEEIISRRDRVVSCAILWRDTRQNCLNPELRLIPMAFCHFQMRQR